MQKLKIFVVEYKHNNSGGHDWLNETDWKNLLKHDWQKRIFDEYTIFSIVKQFRAKNLKNALENAIKEWKRITKRNPNTIGCECCGRPHSFIVQTLKEFESEN